MRGVGLTALPRPERFYFRFAPPVEAAGFTGRADDEDACYALREQVHEAVESGLATLLLERERDPDRSLASRLVHQLLPAPAKEARTAADEPPDPSRSPDESSSARQALPAPGVASSRGGPRPVARSRRIRTRPRRLRPDPRRVQFR